MSGYKHIILRLNQVGQNHLSFLGQLLAEHDNGESTYIVVIYVIILLILGIL